jgi:hypothetical protein
VEPAAPAAGAVVCNGTDLFEGALRRAADGSAQSVVQGR